MSNVTGRDDVHRPERIGAGFQTGLGRFLEVAQQPGTEKSRGAPDRSDDLLDATLDAMPTPVAILDSDGRIIFVNARWRDFLTGCSLSIPGHGVGIEYLRAGILGAVDRRDALALRTALAAILRGRTEHFRLTIRTSLMGQDQWYQVSATRFLMETSTRVVITHEDVSAIHAAHETITNLSQRLLNLQEEERRRIAVELHDSTAQQLTAISLYVMSLRQASAPDTTNQKIFDDIEHSIEEAQKEIRSFSYLLHPPYQDRDGLKATLDRFVDGYARRTGLKVAAEISGDMDGFTAEAQRALLRIIQEGLSNIHRHATATDVLVKLKTAKTVLLLNIADNGRGIEAADCDILRDSPPGLGLAGMRARVRQLGGTLKIFGGKQGTRLFGRIPLARCTA